MTRWIDIPGDASPDDRRTAEALDDLIQSCSDAMRAQPREVESVAFLVLVNAQGHATQNTTVGYDEDHAAPLSVPTDGINTAARHLWEVSRAPDGDTWRGVLIGIDGPSSQLDSRFFWDDDIVPLAVTDEQSWQWVARLIRPQQG